MIKSLAKELGLKLYDEHKVQIRTVGNEETPMQAYKADVDIHLKDGKTKTITLIVLEKLVYPLKGMEVSDYDIHELSDMDYIPYTKIDNVKPGILIGMDYYYDFIPKTENIELKSGFKITQSLLGPIICGHGKIGEPINICAAPSIEIKKPPEETKEEISNLENSETKNSRHVRFGKIGIESIYLVTVILFLGLFPIATCLISNHTSLSNRVNETLGNELQVFSHTDVNSWVIILPITLSIVIALVVTAIIMIVAILLAELSVRLRQ